MDIRVLDVGFVIAFVAVPTEEPLTHKVMLFEIFVVTATWYQMFGAIVGPVIVADAPALL